MSAIVYDLLSGFVWIISKEDTMNVIGSYNIYECHKTTIFRLRTGRHNRLNQHLNRVMKVIPFPMWSRGEAEQGTTHRLNQHLNRVMKVIPFPMCSRGETEQDTAHILQTCRNHQTLREEIWPLPTTLQEKLYGPVDALQKTTRFVAETELQV